MSIEAGADAYERYRRLRELEAGSLHPDATDAGYWDAVEADAEEEEDAGGPDSRPNGPYAEPDAIADYLSADAWLGREFTRPSLLLGELLTTTARVFLIGATGLGKTLLGMAMAVGMASGRGFLGWQCDRPARVLYVDGEMPGELLKSRLADAMRRAGVTSLGKLFVYSADTADAVAARYPDVGTMGPLNTVEGQACLFRLIEAVGGVDVVVFDNVMSLVSGDMKDEVPWSETLPLVAGLTKRQIGQLWLDHAGHNTSRQYGSSTKAWRFDTVGIMTELPEDQRAEKETGFRLSFDAPGKARRRTPETWTSFAPRTIRLVEDRWTAEGSGLAATTRGKGHVKSSLAIFHSALLDAITIAPTAPGSTSLDAWLSECIRRGFVEPPLADETGRDRGNRTRNFRNAKLALLAARWIGIDGKQVNNLTQNYGSAG